MKRNHLAQIAAYLQKHTFLKRIRRIDDNIIECDFKSEKIYCNMQKQKSFIYKADGIKPSKFYKAPFDTILERQLSKAKVLGIEADPNDRILRLHLQTSSSYKQSKTTVQFEFTGRNTNVIILGENGEVVEALRHIDEEASFRVVQPGVKLRPIPPRTIRENAEPIEDVNRYLYDCYEAYEKQLLHNLKQSKLRSVDKKIKKLEKKYKQLENERELKDKSEHFEMCANVILANLYTIKPYDKKLEAFDFEGNPVVIEFPKGIKVNRLSDHFFKKAKRLKQKFHNLHIEKDSLHSKIAFYKRMRYSIEHAKSSNEVELIMPKRARSKARREKNEFETFWVEDFKIYVGRSSAENQKLLEMAKANDIWMHLKDIPSSHCIIKTDKKNLPETVIEQAAKLCVDFSVTYAGKYLVDYTQRKNVTIREGSNVLYVKYNTLAVEKSD